LARFAKRGRPAFTNLNDMKSESIRIGALGEFAAPLTHVEKEASVEFAARNCDQLALELHTLAEVLRSPPDRRANREFTAEESLVKSLIRLRRARDECFGTGLFTDPAWHVLLELHLAKLEQRRISISAAAAAAAVPSTTALRAIASLVSRGLVQRRPNPLDARMTHLELTDDGSARMVYVLGRISK
jgi:DNA-binding MarR family transcriptional regulator